MLGTQFANPYVEAETKVQETADDAALSKMSAVARGYVNDPFIRYFVRRSHRRSPLINRGYYARYATVDLILKQFVTICRNSGTKESQIVSLGAGLDTGFFRCVNNGFAPTSYYELDFPDVTSKKSSIIRENEILMNCVRGIAPNQDAQVSSTANHVESPVDDAQIKFMENEAGGCDIMSPKYNLLTADLRDIAACQAALAAAGINFSVPTLFLSECVLIYLEPEESCAIIAWTAKAFERAVFVTYEQIRPHDAFGQVMARNLEERGYSLRGLHAFPDIQSQTARYIELGYSNATVADLNEIYYRYLPREDVARIERLELFDEFEEWHLMCAHYCFALAVKELPGMDLPPPEAHTATTTTAATQTPHRTPIRTRHRSRSSSSSATAANDEEQVLPTDSPHHLAADVVTSFTEAANADTTARVRAASESHPEFCRSPPRHAHYDSDSARSPSGPVEYLSASGDRVIYFPNPARSAQPSPAFSQSKRRLSSASISSRATEHSLAESVSSDMFSTAGTIGPDIAAITLAQEEINQASALRVATGIDILRDIGQDVDSLRILTQNDATETIVPSAAPLSPQSVASASGFPSPTHHRHGIFLPAIKGSLSMAKSAPKQASHPSSSLESIEQKISNGESINLNHMLFSVDDWRS